MTLHVVDASVFGPLFFDDEKDELFADLPGLISTERCIVPQHWRLEVANQILSGLKRKRMTDAMAQEAIAQIDLFPIAIDDLTGPRIVVSFGLAVQHRLTVYDAAYLELAMRLRLPLVSYDTDLRNAALAENIAMFPK